jgi:hypothetical protein
MRIIPSFVRKEEEEMPPLPETAMIPRKITEPTVTPLPSAPDFSEHDRKRLVMQEAAVAHDEYMRERAAMQERIESHANDAKKIGFLELENNQLRTDMQTLQSDLNDIKRYLSLQKQVYDRFNIKAPEKKPRAPRKSKKAKEQANEQ